MAALNAAHTLGVEQDLVTKDPVEPTPPPVWKRIRAACAALLFGPTTRRQTALCIFLWILIVIGILALLVWLLPKLVIDGIVPLTNKLRKALTPPQVGALLAALLIFMPIVFLPPYPFIWLCAPLLGLWPCFAIVEVSTAVGMLLTFTLGRTLMRHKAEHWASKKPGLQAIFNALDRVGPFKTLVLLRLSPTPYALINYCASVPPSVSVQSFMVASVIALIPRHLVWVYFGRHLKGLAAFLRGQPMPATQMVYNVVVLTVGLVIIIGAAVLSSIYLRRIRMEGAKGTAPAGGGDLEARPPSGSSNCSGQAVGQASGSDNDSAANSAARPPAAPAPLSGDSHPAARQPPPSARPAAAHSGWQ